MEDSHPDPKIFSVRIVSIDYYMSPPIPGLDFCYSSFQGGKVNEVPVIRVYGSTPAGQKTCLHIHRALPYLYVPCSDVVQQPEQEGDACVRLVSHALEKALKLKGSAGSKRQHVHGCSLVHARRFYGYDASEQLYAKLYLYHPQDVSRASKLLLGGSVLEKSLQPHESHIPFLLQFLVDYNLHGMGHLHVSKMKFRHPVPDVFTKKSNYSGQHKQQMNNSFMATNSKADSSGNVSLESPIWLSSTIPETWMWDFPSQDMEDNIFKRLSVCELEGDVAIDDILNQQYKLYSSLSQTLSGVRMVQSLIPIWEEFERTGMHMETISSDTEKPSPQDVLSALSNRVEFENKLLELCDAGNSIPCTPVNTDPMFSQSARSSSDGRDVVESSKPVSSSNKRELVLSQCHNTAEDPEALRLLNWLASSQAAEDINSDDELRRETILSPLMPATAINEVLEKADMAFLSASQQECQDILDSVQDSTDMECKSESETSATALDCNNCSPHLSSKEVIPEVDSKKTIHHTRKTFKTKKNKGKRPFWGSLPLCSAENANDGQSMDVNVGRSDSKKNIGTVTCAGSTIVECSVRDLMRRKRYHRGEPPKVEMHHDVKVTPDKESNGSIISSPEERSDQQDVSPTRPNLTYGLPAVQSLSTLTPGPDGDKAEERVDDKDIDECPPLVDGDYQEVKHTGSKPDDSTLHQEQSTSTSTHYPNDGSSLYMLTPAFLPPSTDEVNKWLFHTETGTGASDFR